MGDKYCVMCHRVLGPGNTHVDTCGERCFKKLLQHQRAINARIDSDDEERLRREREADDEGDWDGDRCPPDPEED